MNELRVALEWVDAGLTCVLVTVIEATGSAPRKEGARLVLRADGRQVGTVGGGEVEERALSEARALLQSSAATRLVEQVATCGGTVGLYCEKLAPSRRLVVVGSGHVGRAVALAAVHAGFRVTVVAPSAPEQTAGMIGVRAVASEDPAWFDAVEAPAATHVVCATGTHDGDSGWAVAALHAGFASVGVVGSAKKAQTIRRQAAAAGVPPRRIDELRCPVGLDIAAVTPEEIAVAVVAELIHLERKGSVPKAWRK
ncbi:MAG: XdhC family protein [Thermoanaerobaculaceae bacterium]|nr:XdhC family protein [Thermoanaerobaculaceae bacterium]MDI9623136.1 XdhC family protein [Acidobacteriota bacterium]NLH10855.1 XdhC family protein [Holophagae bacterium]HPW56557.1 XdhC family protein [Thermoanaerobaculaceae bacterium]